ncbi:MocR-like pyridoxine biosynthesis transcription factor PdxR [Gluconobacter wancherniae]|uniref:MocR-like pyridoxine biosynthesis transcription factor PdxR n=1 Tax=Gluconobacter wancherniae TaxID=1307955 RepID=UPI001B8CC6FE|nr:PLP-dependent aminotransferase family protein [Gluconobacter wancherniae]MBS1064229.1 PLP-dependent aminotransferase family protein [Gluconobacter wancherniae]MBS1095971.1 PLP-dependent aminotransferase family protein [Gluconobacter wancherniae]
MLRPRLVPLDITLNPQSVQPLYLQIAGAVMQEIERGRLSAGDYLPSTRALANALAVNRKTIVLAFEELVAQGWIETSGTSGTQVSANLPTRPTSFATNKQSDTERAAPSQAYFHFIAPPARALAVLEDRSVKLDEGSPDGRLFPADVLARAYRGALNKVSRYNRLSYADPRGSAALRQTIATMLKTERGLPVSAQNICITRGSQHGIFLAAMTLIRPGDIVVVEELTYEPAVKAFQALGAELRTIGLDGDGADINALEALCATQRIAFVFLTPHHQFPTTVSLHPDRRLKVIALARRHGFAILEDDYDHEFHFESQPLLPMASYAPESVIYVGSLSKLAIPALRLGYIVAPAAVIESLAHHVSIVDGMGNIVTEEAVGALIEEGELQRHARKAARLYAERRDAFALALTEEFDTLIRFTAPKGGLAFWLRFTDTNTLDRIERNATGLALRFAGSASYMASPEAPRGLRVGFASMNAEKTRHALRLLKQASSLP